MCARINGGTWGTACEVRPGRTKLVGLIREQALGLNLGTGAQIKGDKGHDADLVLFGVGIKAGKQWERLSIES
ncbi:hypothetical protein CHU98_g3453 [Xylaria longipes]|nr:hypothetical protein CHU98_g3453 [Xylaria longipes]